MDSISSVSKTIGVARSTLLYYERIGIISPDRNPGNGYRVYSQKDIDTLLLVRQLKQAGFSLKESMGIMKGNLDSALIKKRYKALEEKIGNLIIAKDIVQSLLVRATGEHPPDGSLENRGRNWHAEFERKGANAHSAWLQRLGFSNKETDFIRWVSRNMTGNETYMKHFFYIFEQMKRQGPGSKAATLKGFNRIRKSETIRSILEVGCGTGAAALVLTEACDAMITAVDNHQPFLDRFQKTLSRKRLENKIKLVNMDMHDLDFPEGSFDLLWAEGSAYFMGYETALSRWKKFIRDKGYLFTSDAVWLTDTPSEACRAYWRIEYPQMATPEIRERQAQALGYEVIDRFILPREDWKIFYGDMKKKVDQALKKFGMNQTFQDMRDEIRIDNEYGDEYGYLCLLMRKN